MPISLMSLLSNNRGTVFPARIRVTAAFVIFSILAGCQISAAGAERKDGASPNASAVCTGLQGQRIAGAVLKTAVLVPRTANAIEHCFVTGSIEESLRFEIRLPTRWNHKVLYTGGGGWDGYIDLPYNSASSLIDGYVQVASNGGHLSSAATGWEWVDARPFLKNARAQQLYGSMSVHTVLQVAEAIVKKRYGSAPKKHYFEGCSNGGREGLIAASRFPFDFDGIVVHAPAWNITNLSLAINAISKRIASYPLSEAKAGAIAAAVVNKCDGLDGVKDGIVHNVAACNFDPEEIACPKNTNKSSCLTPDEIATERLRMATLKYNNGKSIYPGWAPGSEYKNPSGLPDAEYTDYSFMWGTGGEKSGALETVAEGYIRYWVTSDPELDTHIFEPDRYSTEIDLTSTIIDATPDLSTYFSIGGKLILIHGTDDNAISYRSSVDYFKAVAVAVGGEQVRDKSMEFFLAPGVMHCMGGNGPDRVDLARAVDHWVDGGKRPSEAGLKLERLDASGNVTLSRPLCRYPKFARYSGVGKTEDASSYVCAER
jgi:hypothetical protein